MKTDAEFLAERVLPAVQRLSQTQVATNNQLIVLEAVANKLGLYDAADWLATASRLRIAREK